MKKSVLHAYKKIMACMVVVSVIMSPIETLYANTRGPRVAPKDASIKNVTDISAAEMEEMARLLLLLGNRASRPDAPPFNKPDSHEIVSDSPDSGVL